MWTRLVGHAVQGTADSAERVPNAPKYPVAIAVVWAGGLGAILPTSAAGEGLGRDAASGHGGLGEPGDTCTGAPIEFCYSFDFDATSDPSGGDPSGQVHVVVSDPNRPYTFEGPVSCLAVTGNQAVIGVDTNFDFVGILIRGAYVTVTDGGPPSSGLDTIDHRIPLFSDFQTCRPPTAA